MLAVLEYESDMAGDVGVVKKREAGQINMFKLSSPNWPAAKIHPEWQHDVKTYRINNFRDRIPSDPLRHPKLEVFLPGKTSIPAKRYLEIGQDLDKTIFSLLNFMGPLEYVPDMYFDPEKTIDYRYRLPKWEWIKVKDPSGGKLLGKAQEDNPFRALKVLAYIGLQSEGCADIKDLLDNLDIPKSTLWRYISSLRVQGLIDINRSDHTYVFFKKRSVWEQLRDSLLSIVTAMDIGLKKIYGEYFLDSGMIRHFRDRAKNLKPIKKPSSRTPKFEKIVVETIREADQLNKEFKELGINKRSSIRSTRNTMTHSRVVG